MNPDKRGERVLFACLLAALIVGIFALKFWMISVEERLADNLEIHWDRIGTTNSQTNILEIHETRLRRVEHASWAKRDNPVACNE